VRSAIDDVECVGDSHDATGQIDVRPGKAEWLAVAIPPLVVL
jgi:hypothetical protein